MLSVEKMEIRIPKKWRSEVIKLRPESENNNPDDLLRKIESLASRMPLEEPEAQPASYVTKTEDEFPLVEESNDADAASPYL